MKKHGIFTKTELGFTILVLCISAAFAIPKYISSKKESHINAVIGLESAIRSTSKLVRTIAQKRGVVNNTAVIDARINKQVKVSRTAYYPLASKTIGIVEALENYDGFTPTGNNPVTFSLDNAPIPSQCSVSYDIDADKPNIKTIISGC